MTTIESVLLELHQSFNSYIRLLPMDILNMIINNFLLNTDSLEKIRDFLLLNDNFIIKIGYERIQIYSLFCLTCDILGTYDNIRSIVIECELEDRFISCSINKYLNYRIKYKNENENISILGYRNHILNNEITFIGICKCTCPCAYVCTCD